MSFTNLRLVTVPLASSANPATAALRLQSPITMDSPRHCFSLIAVTLWLALSSAASSSTTSVLTRSSELSVEKMDVLTSTDGIFSCGFFKVGNNAFTFSIWYNPIKIANNDGPSSPSRADVVWSANRDRPVNGRRSRVLLQGRNLLVLIDGYDDSIVWTTAISASSGSYGQRLSNISAASEKAELLDTGNLVLEDTLGNILWQSFDFPTDTLLPGQPLTKSTRLVSSVSTSSLFTGYNAFAFDNDNVLRLIYDGPSSIYWPDLDKNLWENGRTILNNSRYAVLDQWGVFISSDHMNFTASDHSLPINTVRRRLTLDPDGNLRLYSRRTDSSDSEKINGWYVSWQAWMDVCRIHGLCGRNAICTYSLEPVCTCPPGYRRANPASWKDGCKPIFTTAGDSSKNFDYFCPSNGHNSSYQFVEVPHADFYGSDIAFIKNISFDTCKSTCEQDCKCQAFVYRKSGQGFCYPKAILFNGYSSLGFPSSLFLKLPRDFAEPLPNITFLVDPDLLKTSGNLLCNASATVAPKFEEAAGGRSTNRLKRAYGYSFAAAFGLIELLFIATGWWFLYRRADQENSLFTSLEPATKGGGYRYKQLMSNHFRVFNYHEIKRATNNFKQQLGKGASGEVYKGVLDDKRVVAVKRLPDAEKGIHADEEFRAELSVIGRIYHMNLVRMWGFCTEFSRRILIYEFVDNGSLDKTLFSPLIEDPKTTNNTNESDLENDFPNILTSSPGHLHQQNVLSWQRRFGIALGTARGLAYLHHECLEWIIHCDIKPENILLDADYQPKIADFGLVKLTQRDSPGSQLSHVRGTKGYMAPEWTSNVPITAKVDVYSYGIILLELLRGARLSTWNPIYHRSTVHRHDIVRNQLDIRSLIHLLKEKLASAREEHPEEGKVPSPCSTIIEEFVDPRLHGDFNIRQAQVMLEIALSCTEEDRNKRPTMASVVQMLLNSCESQSEPSKLDCY